MLGWKALIGGGFLAGVVAVSVPFYYFHEQRVEELKEAQGDAIKAAVAAVTKTCSDAQKETYHIGETYEREVAEINKRHASVVKRLRSEGTRTVAVAVPALTNHEAATAGVRGMVGIDPVAVADQFRICDEQAEQLIGAQSYIKKRVGLPE